MAPPFYTSAQSMTGPQPPSPVARTSTTESRTGEGQRQLPPTVPPLVSQKLPPPAPHVKPPSPFHPSSTGIRPVFSSAPSIVPPTSSLSSPSLAPPSVFTSSSYPFFPPVSMARTANHSHSTTSSGFSASFLAPSPPTVAAPPPPQPKYSSPGAPMAFGDQPFSLTRPPFSAPSFAPISSAKPVTSAAEPAPATSSRPSSRTSSSSFNNDSNSRPGSLPFPGHSSSTRSPSLPPPLAPSTFPTPGRAQLGFMLFIHTLNVNIHPSVRCSINLASSATS